MTTNLRTKLSLIDEYLLNDKLDIEAGRAVVISYDGETIFSKGFGKARLTGNVTDITTDTIMSIQSISKSFAATCIMSLVEKGLIQIEDPVVKYLPYFKLANKEVSDSITVKQLLSHTSGLGMYPIANMACTNRKEFPIFEKMYKDYHITKEMVAQIQKREDITKSFSNVELTYAPSNGWNYCSDAYAIIGDIIDKVAGEPWENYAQKHIFEPLQMTRTTLDPTVAMNDKNSARYYTMNVHSVKSYGQPNPELPIVEAPFPSNPIASPIGFIYSTANDLTKYMTSQMGIGKYMILTNQSLQTMHSTVKEIDNKIGYGLGWFTRTFKDEIEIIEHGGGYVGVNSHILMVPKKKISIAVLSNYDKFQSQEVATRILEYLI
ncbi:serine hydrolase domain-containing protein [Bacillus massilinigeriensis]|uniref:serine hydrolase domain-containing protein n=1 Tax=Bacillus massilionigeriensis TaxID=1805475 RepID=UPI00096B6256|nr:serine hydrolase domain-containing protein [Bacillus massilionigeriensis]